MNSCFRSLVVLPAVIALTSCDPPEPPAAVAPPAAAPITAETEAQLAEARDALQRQALEIDTKTALMEKQLAEMEKALKDRENAELRGSLDALKRQNDDLRVQAEAARRQSAVITQRIATTAPRVTVPPPVAVPRDYSMFYDRLAPYGRWLDVGGYGYCWRPTITVAGWRPYVDGCWVWSSYGWTWQSNEPYGWAVYHYGRWVNLSRYGWVWVPGSDWAPAWVAWRQSRDCVGWAPLPPEPGAFSGVYRDCDSRYGLGPASYTFIATNHFVQSSYTRYCAPVTQNTTIFQQSVNVTQIVPRGGHEHAFVHHGGPPRAQMEQACGRPVPQRQVRTLPADQMPAQRPGHHRDESLSQPVIVELPPARAGAPRVRPQIADRIEKPKRVDAFEGVPQRVVAEIRHTIAADTATAAVQQQPVAVTTPVVASETPVASPAVTETVLPAIAVSDPATAGNITPAAEMPPHGRKPRPDAVEPKAAESGVAMPAVVETQPAVVETTETKASETNAALAPAMPEATPVAAPVEGAVKTEPVIAASPAVMTPNTLVTTPPVVETIAPATVVETKPAAVERMAPQTVENAVQAPSMPATAPVEPVKTEPVIVAAPEVMPPAGEPAPNPQAMQEKQAVEQAAAAEVEKARLLAAEQQAQAAAMQQQADKAAEQAQAAVEAEKARMQAAQQQEEIDKQQRMAAEVAEKERQQAEAAAMQQQQEQIAAQQRAATERMAAEQAAEAERVRKQAEAATMQQQRQQQEELAARQRAAAERMAAEQTAEAERARQQVEAAAMQQQRQQQEELAAQQRAAAERMAAEQAAEAERARQQAEAAAMQRQQEAEMRRAQEMAQRQAEEQARRAAEEQMRAQQEAAQRAAQEMAQRQAEEAARRAQEEAQRAAAEAAQRAAAEAARNQPPPAPPGS